MRLFLLSGVLLPVLQAQLCPPVSFQQGNPLPVVDARRISGIQRQPDGSFTQHWYQKFSPYNQVSVVPNAQTAALDCSGLAARPVRTPPAWIPLADQRSSPMRTVVFSNFLGNGTPVGLALVAGRQPGGPAVESLAIAIPKADGSAQSTAFYPVIPARRGLLVADLNQDGKRDVVAISAGSLNDPTNVMVLMGNGDGTVQTGVRYTAGSEPASAVTADFNGDGNMDLAVANYASKDVSILLGRGDGTFGATSNFTVGVFPGAVAAADLNGDGKVDLAVGSPRNVVVLMGNGNGTFASPAPIPVNFNVGFLVAADVNKDSRPDLVFSSTEGTVSILLGDGTGKFPIQNHYAGADEDPQEIFATDFDGDGNLDIVAASGHPDVLGPNPYDQYVRVYFGRGDGTLIAAPLENLAAPPRTILLADFDGDTHADVVVAADEVRILPTRADGTFKPAVTVPLSGAGTAIKPRAIVAGDLNGDGKQDLVAGDPFGDGVYVLLGNANNTFQTAVRYAVGNVTTGVTLADFNGDGKLDLAIVGSDLFDPQVAKGAGVLLGNGDGTFQAIRKLSGLGSMPHSLAVGDFNRDGRVDLAISDAGDYVSTSDPGSLLVFIGKGDGTFQSGVSYPSGSNGSQVVAADVNADSLLDLVLVTTNVAGALPRVVLLAGNGDGTFRSALLFPTDAYPQAVAVADLNGDGKQDLVVAHCCGLTTTSYKLGNGDGTFQADVDIQSAVNTTGLAIVDLNGDKKLDIVAGMKGADQFPNFGYLGSFINIGQVAPALNPLTNVNGASFLAGPLAPDSFATAQGVGLATTTQASNAPYPTILGGSTVKVKDSLGVERLAGLAYVSPAQINYIVPTGTAAGAATITVTSGDGTVSQSTNTIAPVSTGLFLFGGTNLLAANVLRVKPDFSQSVEDVYQISGGALVPKPIDLGPDTDQVYLVLYATGLRGSSQANVTVTANGVNMPVLYSGMQPQYPGLDQIDALIPRSLMERGDVTVRVTVGGIAANPGHVTIR